MTTEATPIQGTVRLGNKRKGAAAKPRHDETVVDIDRSNPILGNPFILRNHTDNVRRAEVIRLYKEKFEADLAQRGPMTIATEHLAARVRNGEKLILMCWCSPRPCHGDLILDQITRLNRFACE